jgi:hypothetical protein
MWVWFQKKVPVESDDSKTGDSVVLDVAQRMELRELESFGSHAGQSGNRHGVQ